MRTFLRPLEQGTDAPWWKRIDPLVATEWAAVLLVALFYAAFKTYAMWLREGDEHIYFAMARAVGHGALPYRDFFFAHPPVHLLLPALIFRIFGFSYGVAFWIAPLSCLAAGLAVWRLVRRFSVGWVGVLALFLFLFGRTVVQSASHLTGVNMGLMFLCWGLERLAADKPKAGGILLGLSVLTGLYFLPAVAGALALYAFFRPRRSLQSIGVCLLLVLGVAAVFDLLTRGQFMEQVVWYHRAKGSDVGTHWPTFASTKGAQYFHGWPLFLGTIIGGLVALVAFLVVADARGARRARQGDAPRRGGKKRGAPVAAPSSGGGALAAALRTVEPADEAEPPAEAAGFWAWLAGHRWSFLAALGRGALAVGRPLNAARRKLIVALRPAPWAALGLAAALWVACHWIFLATLPVVWTYYYAVVFIGAAIATALMAFAVWRGLRTVPRLLAGRAHGTSWSPLLFAGAIAAAFGLGYGHDMTLGKKYDIWSEDKQEQKAASCTPQGCAVTCTNDGKVDGRCDSTKGCVCRYGWHDSPAAWIPHWFNAAMRSLFWGGDEIPDGQRYGAIENTLWHESRGAPVEPRYLDAAHAIAGRACSGDTVFGDSGTAPMLANLTGLRIAAGYFDTNQQRFETGYIEPPAEIVARLKADGLRFIVLGNNTWAKDGPIADLVKHDFRPLWPGPGESPFGITVYVTKAPGRCE